MKSYTVFLTALVCAALVGGVVGAQVETLPVTWQPVYTVDRTAVPEYIVDTYMSNPEGTIAAALEAIDQSQTWIDEISQANNLTPLSLRNQLYSHIRSVRLVEAEHYVEQRAIERGVTRENDPKFFASLDTLRNGG